MNNTNNLYAILDKIEIDYALYIGKKSLERLSLFISIYTLIYFNFTGEHLTFWSEFQSFTEHYYETKYQIENQCWRIKGWSDIIQFFSASDEDAFETFYKLYSMFKKKKENSH